MKNKLTPALLLASTLFMGGCMFHGGHEETIYPPTLGQELIDLKTALDSGVISEQEHTRKKVQLTSSRKTAAAKHKD